MASYTTPTSGPKPHFPGSVALNGATFFSTSPRYYCHNRQVLTGWNDATNAKLRFIGEIKLLKTRWEYLNGLVGRSTPLPFHPVSHFGPYTFSLLSLWCLLRRVLEARRHSVISMSNSPLRDTKFWACDYEPTHSKWTCVLFTLPFGFHTSWHKGRTQALTLRS